MGEAHVHLCGDDYLVEVEGFEWVASVSCVCDAGAVPAAGPERHWHEVARADTFTALVTLLSVRQILEAA
jgi:hypothetical protein